MPYDGTKENILKESCLFQAFQGERPQENPSWQDPCTFLQSGTPFQSSAVHQNGKR